MLTKCLEKKRDGNYTRMLQAILNKSWRQHLTKHQLYSHLPLITKTIKIRRTRHAEHCWRSKDEPICDVIMWTPSHRRSEVGQLPRTYIQQLCAYTECSPKDLPGTMDDRDGWWKRASEIFACSVTWWWWWWWWWYICVFVLEEICQLSPKLCRNENDTDFYPYLPKLHEYILKYYGFYLWKEIDIGFN